MYRFISLLSIILALIYPFCLTKLIKKQIKDDEEKNIKTVIKNIIILILITIGTILICIPILEIYSNSIPDTSSNQCSSSGGWTHTCTGNDKVGSIYFIILSIIFIVHSIISYKCILKIFKSSNTIFQYIFSYLYIFSLYVCQLMLVLFLYGLLFGYL